MAKKKKRRKVSKTLARKWPSNPKSRGPRLRKLKSKKRSVLLARGGGNATAAGVTFQASIGAVFATQMLTESPGDDRLGLATFRPKSVRFESDAPIDDITVETDQGGWVFVQGKTTLDFSTSLASEFGKTAEQIVRQWHAGRAARGSKGWDRPLVLDRDRLLIAVGPNTAKTITTDLAKALASLRAHASAPLPERQHAALKKLKTVLGRAWKRVTGRSARASDIDALLPFIAVLRFDMAGPDRTAAIAQMRHLTATALAAKGGFIAIELECQALMEKRHGADATAFRQAVTGAGVALKAAPSYQPDVEKLRKYSQRVAAELNAFEVTQVEGKPVSVERAATSAVVAAAKAGSLLVIGEPGSGKSAIVSAAASVLRAERCEVIQFAVDRLPVDTADGLRAELDLAHRVPELLENWPGKKPGYVFIDALDATRGGRGEAVFRTLIQDILALSGNRWRVVASIRSFDLRLGERFRDLFSGKPPDEDFYDKSFPSVRHINVPAWSEAEFADLLSKAPSLATAISQGGQKLRDLAAVPFNTRLLADLLSSGLSPAAFGEVGTQVELLGIYWGRRVTPLGNAADVCLRAALDAMVTAHTLQAERITVATAGPSGLDGLLLANVLVPVIGDRYVSFRHHILFDYAASRLFIDPLNIGAITARLVEQPGLALMLAPALGYALHDVWLNSASGHPEFWSAVVELTGHLPSDPVARSVAGRMASELPKDASDVEGMVRLLQSANGRERAAKAFTQIVGALTVRIEDGLLSVFAPWCRLAKDAAPFIEDIAWPLRTLLSQIVSKVTDEAQRNQLGLAARALLSCALSNARIASLVTVGIDLVCDTYATDIPASRALLALLMTGERFDKHSHEDMPALARKTGRVAQYDADFAVEIYRTIFTRRVTDTSATSMGNSQILALTSNRRQDYDHARWQLSQYVPGFLERDPELGCRLLLAALEGIVASEHHTNAPEQRFDVAGRTVVLINDHSHIWAHDPDDRHAHASNDAGMIGAFKNRLLNAAPNDAVQLANLTIASNRLAILWARMFLAAARRADVFATVMWPYASRPEFLRSADTRKDAIDAIAAAYPRVDSEERRQFEDAVFAMPFEGVENPDRARRRLLTLLFNAIGLDNLITDAARRVFTEDAAHQIPRDNRRAVSIWSEVRPVEPYYWLTDKGIDINAPCNADLLALAEAVPGRPSPAQTPTASVADAVRAINALVSALQNPPNPPPSPFVVDYAHDALLKGCGSLARRKEALLQETDVAQTLAKIVEPYLGADELTLGSGETSVQLRASAVEAAMLIAAVNQATADKLVPSVERHLASEHEKVREEIADNLGALWEFSRDTLWRFADYFAQSERAYPVLQRFTNFLCRAIHAAPEKTEELMITMIPHARHEIEARGDRIIEAIGNFTAILWMRYELPHSRELLREWLADLAAHEPELNRAATTLRDAVTIGYETSDPEDARLRHNAQRLANEFVDVSARILDNYLAMEPTSRMEADHARVRAVVRLCDNVGDQLYFSSGAFRANEQEPQTGLVSIRSRLSFLTEMQDTLRRIGDVGTPHTIYYLIDMLRFLRPADPERVFDLVAHSLLNAGRKHGFQFEGMGNDRFVEVVGIFLADNREIFNDPARRANLIECLDAFVEAGWPSARRLLYRLPELL